MDDRRPLTKVDGKRHPHTLWYTTEEWDDIADEGRDRGFAEVSPFAVKLSLHGLKHLRIERLSEAPTGMRRKMLRASRSI